MRSTRTAFASPALAAALVVLWAGAALGADSLERRPFLGIAFAPLTDEIRVREKLVGTEGLWIQAVTPGSSAAKAGIEPDAVVLEIDGRPVGAPGLVTAIMRDVHTGQKVALRIQRNGKRESKSVRLLPLPYEASTEFTIEYGSIALDGARYRTIVTRPKDDGKHPAFYIVQGLGCFSVDSPMGPGFYGPVVSELTRRGYVTFRVDKPGTGDSEGDPCPDVDFLQELRVYRAALEAVKAHPNVDPGKVFLFGHSMGGVMAPMLIHDVPVLGAIVYGTGFRSWMEYELENSRRQSLLSGAGYAETEDSQRDAQLFLALFYPLKWPLSKILAEYPQFRENWPDSLHMHAGKTYRYFQQIYGINMPKTWQETDAYVLAMHGRSDFVSAAADHEELADAVNREHPGKGTYVALEGTDHWLHRAGSEQQSMQQLANCEFNPAFVEEIDRWMKSVLAREGESSNR